MNIAAEHLNPRDSMPPPPTYRMPGNGLGEALRHARLHMDLAVPKLVDMALQRGEAVLADSGALCVRTGLRTGRSPKDRFIVDDPKVDAEVDWGEVNRPLPWTELTEEQRAFQAARKE